MPEAWTQKKFILSILIILSKILLSFNIFTIT